MFFALAAIGLASCNGGFKKGEGGLLYNIHVDKGGPSIKEGDFISVNLIAKTDGDSVLFSTYETGHPSLTLLPKPQFKGDIYAALKFLAEGDSATIKTSIDSTMKKGVPRPPFKGKYIIYEVKVEKVIAKGNLSDQVFAGRYGDYIKTLSEAAKKAEPVKIKKYIADNNLKVTQTASGLNYIITKQGSGIKPVPGDTVVVNYTVKLTSGKVLETSVRAEAQKAKIPANPMSPYKPVRFAIGVKGMIKGWDEGMQLLNKGATATLILPSDLAYGGQGYQQIQPFTPLVFDVELVDVVPPNPNAPKPAAPVMMPAQAQPQPVKK